MAVRKATKKKTTKKTPVVRNRGGGRYSESEYWAFIRSGLRAKSNRWPVKYDCLNAAKRPYKGPNKRQKFEFLCNFCKDWFPQKLVSVDHIFPIGSLRCADDLSRFVTLLFCEMDNLQVLCKECHDEKTRRDRLQRCG